MSIDVNQCYACHVGFHPGSTFESSAMLQRHAACGSLTPCRMVQSFMMAVCSSWFSAAAPTAMRVLLYDRRQRPRAGRHHRFRSRSEPLGRHLERLRAGRRPGQLYHFQADGPHEPQRGYRFDPQARLIDPYCKALAGDFLPADGGIVRPPQVRGRSTKRSTGKAIATCAAACRKR